MATHTTISELRDSWYSPDDTQGAHGQGPQPQIALLTPYSGNNLGDAAIQDSMIANLRLRLPGAQFSGITLNCDNFLERHGTGVFPLYGVNGHFKTMPHRSLSIQAADVEHLAQGLSQRELNAAVIKRAIKRLPVVGRCMKKLNSWGKAMWCELRHSVEGYRFLCAQDLLVVSGGGQLDDEWGGPWRHPFALFKWTLLARIAKVPCAIVSVGAGKMASKTSQLFITAALRMARYRSYRDISSRAAASALLPRAAEDPVVPDIAFSLPRSEFPLPAGMRPMAQGRTVVVISPIAYAKPGSWPHADRELYERYLAEMAHVISHLLEHDCFLIMVSSTLSDASVIYELLEDLDHGPKERVAMQMHVPMISTWQNLVASLQDADFLIASRLHSTVLGFMTGKPTIAISFDPKVDRVMEDLRQTDYLLQIRDFTAEDVIGALQNLKLRRRFVVEEISSYWPRVHSASSLQYDALAELAMASDPNRKVC